MKSSSFTAALIALTAAPVLAGTSTALAPITPAPEETSWQVRTAMYGWAQGLEGDIGIKGITTPVDIGFDVDPALEQAIEAGTGQRPAMIALQPMRAMARNDALSGADLGRVGDATPLIRND